MRIKYVLCHCIGWRETISTETVCKRAMHKKNDESTRNLGFDTDFSRISFLFFFHTGTIVIFIWGKYRECRIVVLNSWNFWKIYYPHVNKILDKKNSILLLCKKVISSNGGSETVFAHRKKINGLWTANAKWYLIILAKVKHSVQAFIYFCLLQQKNHPAIRRKGVGNVQITTMFFQSICKASKSNGFDKCFKKILRSENYLVYFMENEWIIKLFLHLRLEGTLTIEFYISVCAD